MRRQIILTPYTLESMLIDHGQCCALADDIDSAISLMSEYGVVVKCASWALLGRDDERWLITDQD